MDGFAVRMDDLASASREHPVSLPVAGSIQAGESVLPQVVPGTVVRIMTGAALPTGTEAVVPLEDSEELPDGRIAFTRPTVASRHVRPAGEDVPADTVAVPAGKLVRAPEIGLFCALGIQQVSVIRRPRVAIISTGTELLDPHEELVPGKIRDANNLALAACVAEYGAQPIPCGIARDTQQALQTRIEAALDAGADMILTSAGASAGDYDVVSSFMRVGEKLEVWRVNLKPGRPLLYGRCGAAPLIGLPGNPASALIVAELFVKPAIHRLRGLPFAGHPTVQVVVDSPQKGSKRRHYVRAYVTREGHSYHATTRGIGRGSGSLSTLVRANALLIIPEGTDEVAAGSIVEAILL
jgi:molybdopterin molybdotransferase